jgi:hypothetical protein
MYCQTGILWLRHCTCHPGLMPLLSASRRCCCCCLATLPCHVLPVSLLTQCAVLLLLMLPVLQLRLQHHLTAWPLPS